MLQKYIVLLMLVVGCSANSAETLKTPFVMRDSQVLSFHSQLLARDYDLYIQLPPSYSSASAHRYPILILNDADYAFPVAASSYRQLRQAGHVEDIILVGISYSKGDSGGLSRSRDYLPTHSPNESVGHSSAAKLASGHAAEYLQFIRHELLPYLGENYNADLQHAGLTGHSFGGLFAAYTLANAPDTFRYYVIADPSLWYDDEVMLKLIREGASSSDVDFVLVGADPFPDRDDGPQKMVTNTLALGQLLESKFGKENVRAMIFDYEVHESIFPIALTRGLRILFSR